MNELSKSMYSEVVEIIKSARERAFRKVNEELILDVRENSMKNVELNKWKNILLNLPNGFTYTAHAGCVNTPDDSLESIDAGVKYNAAIVEIDLNFNADNVPVLSHDTPKGGEITLDEAFERISKYENLKVNVDVKYTSNLKEVVVLADKYGITDRIFFTGVTPDFVSAIHDACPNIPYYLNVEVRSAKKRSKKYLRSLVQLVKDSGAIGINFNKDSATKKLVDIFHENGLLVSIWTVDKERDICKILTMAPDNITTKQPDRIKIILENAE